MEPIAKRNAAPLISLELLYIAKINPYCFAIADGGNNLKKTTQIHPVLLLLVFVAAFLSYQKNFFATASDWWFETHASMPTQYVLDGILHARETGDVVPGLYLRENNDNPRALYTQGDKNGAFIRYDSQYGLQVKFFAALAAWGFSAVEQMQAVAAALMALTVMFLVRLVARDFSCLSAVSVAAIFILSPWIVIFARNLFWVSFTWFLPLVITMYYSIRVYETPAARWRMLALFYGAMLLKLLCGYEFITSIVIAAYCPLLYQAMLKKIPLWHVLKLFMWVGGGAFAAFATAALIHISAIAETRAAGFETFRYRAERRFYSEDPQMTAKQSCPGDAECEKIMLASLTASPVDVVKIYLVMPEFLPWLSTTRLSEAERHAFKSRLDSTHGIAKKIAAIRASPVSYWFFIAAKILNPAAFIGFMLTCIGVAMRSSRAAQGLLLLSFIAPLSWFVAAKGFCYIHAHLCFVVWYIPFIVYGTILIGEKIAHGKGTA